MINIVLIEDNISDARLVEEALKDAFNERFVLHHFVRVHEAMDFLHRHKAKFVADVILSDISLPDAVGVETIELLNQAAINVPVIFMTDSNDTSLALGALQQGAQDYLIKGDYSSGFLVRVIRYAIERKKYQAEVSSARANAKALRQQARLLRREQEHLRLLNKAKDDFISIASHQLRTPATGVKQFIGMILEGFAGEVPEHLKPFLIQAYESNERQLSIVNDLLKVAQLDAGNIVLHCQPTNLTVMMTNIASEQCSKFNQRCQELVFEPHGPDVVAEVDPERMRMVFDNLIDNASKYTDERKKVTIRVGEDDNTVMVGVSDQGVGIAPENIEKVFEKFNRVANPRSELVGGTGLGLYWAKQIVDLHHGDIDVNSQLGKGSEFIVRLNRRQHENAYL